MKDSSVGQIPSIRKKILIICDFYLPSTKSGGGMWTVANLVDRFCDRHDFFILTRNYDSKGDTDPFKTVETGEWNQVGNASVFYVAARNITRLTITKIVNQVAPDCVFLNSAMSLPAVKFLMARTQGHIKYVPVVLAPCGELSQGALKGKSLKKRIFLRYAKTVGLFKDVIWKASTEMEVQEIRRSIGSGVTVCVAPDLTPKTILPNFSSDLKPRKESGSARFVFLSRLVRKKNLKYFLERLRTINGADIELEIVGPLEDQAYWRECRAEIDRLPANIKVVVVGAVSYPEGLERLCSNQFFVLPTLNENFGYVLIESLAAGCPLLTTDNTPWKDIEQRGVGWQLPLENPDGWIHRINKCIQMKNDDYRTMSAAAREYAVEWLAKPESDEATARVLSRALGEGEVQ